MVSSVETKTRERPSAEKDLAVSVVAVTFQSAHCIRGCLESVQRLLRPFEIIVVDNASDDGSAAVARSVAPHAVVLEPGANLGFGRACNLAVRRAHGDVVLFVNPDVVLTDIEAVPLQVALAADPFGLLVPLVAPSGGRPRHQIFPYRRWPLLVLGQAWEHLRPRELKRPRRTARSAMHAWAAAPALLVRRDEFLAAGGFDERYFLYAEDMDLSRRYRQRGLPLRATAALVAAHSGGASSAGEPTEARIAADGWSLLGTLEYLSIWEGPAVAARAARLVTRSFALQRATLRAARHVPGLRGRAGRKARQVEELGAFLREHVASERGYCPGAAAALR